MHVADIHRTEELNWGCISLFDKSLRCATILSCVLGIVNRISKRAIDVKVGLIFRIIAVGYIYAAEDAL